MNFAGPTWTANQVKLSLSLLFVALFGGVASSGCVDMRTSNGLQTTASALTISIVPAHATVEIQKTLAFAVNVTGDLNANVVWTVLGPGCTDSSCGTLGTSGLSAVYVAPLVAPSPATVTLLASDTRDKTQIASATITIVPKVVVDVTPRDATVAAGFTRQFRAAVAGTPDQTVRWTVSGADCSSPGCGAISSSGLYTAPSTTCLPQTVTVTAASAVDTEAASTALIHLDAVANCTSSPPPIVPEPSPVQGAPAIGINVSEAEYSWGSFGSDRDLAYLSSKNIRLVRLPIAWERLQPTLGGPLNQTYVAAMVAFIKAAGIRNMEVIVDLHNYGRYNRMWAKDAAANYGYTAVGKGDVIGSAEVPISAFADLWSKLARALSGTLGLAYYDIMNEPYNMGDATVWPSAAQAAVNAIRSVDSDTAVLVEGTQWASAYWWSNDNANLHVTDQANKILYEAHLYFDPDGSGTYKQSYTESKAYPNIGVDRLQPFLEWLRKEKAKGFVGEFGIPGNDPQWLPVLDNFLTAVQGAGLSGTYWNYVFHSPSDPSWWPSNDTQSIRLDNGQANPQLEILAKHNAPRE
jgi:aryl-phospho-beta-D-glucosidase BglC (GH1 family)